MFSRDLVEVRTVLAQVCAGYGDGGDRGGFGAKDSRTEGDGLPGVVGKEQELFGGPTALGTDGEGDARRCR